MKRVLKRILPIFLCLIVICSIAWYLFIYDPDFTQAMLLSGARYFENQGNHTIATWLYNQAYYQSGNDDDVIIELADQFKNNGNYTKAEVTLSKAISDGGTVKLYTALSQIYIEQDKLLDAANMLDNITDPELKAQLDALRPSAPVANPAPGFYNQYITVHFEIETPGQLFVSDDGDFPSVRTDLYKDPVQLSAGENTIYAISVGENGLVSQPSYFGYTVGGVIEEITISDPVMDALLRDMIGVESDAKLMTNDLWSITELTVPADATDLSDLAKLPYLQTLVIENKSISTLQMISSLSLLNKLTIRSCLLSSADLSIIGALPNLEHLVLSDCSLSNIESLSSSSHLVTLDLSNNAIRDVTPLSFMQDLIRLDLSNNALTNLSPLSALTSLQELNVSYNSLTSIAPLISCTSLTKLFASANQLTDLPNLSNENLALLDVSNNLLTNVDILGQYTSLTDLNVSKNQLTDISALSALTNLKYLQFSRNEVTTLPEWKTSAALVAIDGSYNKLTSVAPLKGMMGLNRVILDYNEIANINPLADCYNLIQVDIFGNPVADVTKLTDLDIIVNYDPT